MTQLYAMSSSSSSARVVRRPLLKFHRFFVLRHGETDANACGIIQGSSDFSRLTDRGRDQAANCGTTIFGIGGSNRSGADIASPQHIDCIYVSPLTRAQETLSILRQHAARDVLPPDETVLHDLREIDLYEWEGQRAEDLKVSDATAYDAWKVGDAHAFFVSGRQPIVETWKRATTVWDTIRQHQQTPSLSLSTSIMEESKSDNVETHEAGASTTDVQQQQLSSSCLLVCHGTLGQALLCTAFGWNETHFRQHEFPNCGLVEILWNVDDPVATSWKWHYPKPTERLHPLIDTTLA